MDSNDLIKKRLSELYNRSYMNGYCTYSDFLNMEEQSILSSLKLPHLAFGGYDMAQRVVAGFGDYADKNGFPIVCVCVSPVQQKFADSLNHRDFLGAIMNLGIKRELIGDIIISDNKGYVFCLEQISDYIADNLQRIKHTTVKAAVTDELPQAAVELPDVSEIIVSSIRLDVMVSGVYKLSRSDASRLMAADKIFVNSHQINSNSYMLKNGDVVSVRGYGRFIFEEELRKTKKDRIVAAVRIYK